MYYNVVRQYAQALRNLSSWLDKAEQHAKAHNLDIQTLLDARLAPDMATFIYQVTSACDYIKGAAARLTGQTPPRHEDNEKTIDEVRDRIKKTIAYVETVDESQYATAAEQQIRVSWSPPGKAIGGEDYLAQVSNPNVYFHLVTAYAILRHKGVEIGKMDFVGPIDWVDA